MCDLSQLKGPRRRYTRLDNYIIAISSPLLKLSQQTMTYILSSSRCRIRDAAAQLPGIRERTNLSFSAFELALDKAQSRSNSQDTQRQDDTDFKTPMLPASALYKTELIKLREQMELQRRETKVQLEQPREDARVQREQLAQQKELRSLLKKHVDERVA